MPMDGPDAASVEFRRPSLELKKAAMSRLHRRTSDLIPVEVRSAMTRTSTRSSVQDSSGDIEVKSMLTRTSSRSSLQDILAEADIREAMACMSPKGSLPEPFAHVEHRSSLTQRSSQSSAQRSSQEDLSNDVRKLAMCRAHRQPNDLTPVEVRSAMTRRRSSVGENQVKGADAKHAPTKDLVGVHNLPGLSLTRQTSASSESGGTSPKLSLQALPHLLGVRPNTNLPGSPCSSTPSLTGNRDASFGKTVVDHNSNWAFPSSSGDLSTASIQVVPSCPDQKIGQQYGKKGLASGAQKGIGCKRKTYRQRASRAVGRIAGMLTRVW